MKYKKKPIIIEALQWDGSNVDEVLAFILTKGQARRWANDKIIIETLEGPHTASKGDWIIKGIQGEFYPCKPDIFTATYEIV